MAEQQHTPEIHVTPLTTYLLVFAALAGGTLLTWWVSTINVEVTLFGTLISLNTPIALLIATIKAVLVILFFMHVIHSTRLTWVVVVGAFLWLGRAGVEQTHGLIVLWRRASYSRIAAATAALSDSTPTVGMERSFGVKIC